MIDVDELVAPPGARPQAWQAEAPVLGYKPPIGDTPDVRRVVALPRRSPPDLGTPESRALAEAVSARLRLPNPPPCRCRADFDRDCVTTLREIQAHALVEIARVGGLLAPIGVGHGKTFLNLLAPLVIRGCRTALLLVPPNLTAQLVRDYRMLGQHFRLPALVMHDAQGWAHLAPGVPVLHVLPYSRLSRPESTAWISELAPDLIIADECDKLRHADTATTSRVLRYFASAPATRLCAWSGSLSEASIKDYAHLSMLALRDGSPLPLDPEVVKEWSGALDADVGAPAPPGALLELCEPGEHVREGYHRRLVETAGVIRTDTAALEGVDLVMRDRPATAPHAITAALADLRATWCRPDGEELIDAMAMKRCARELAAGFYYRWRFPRGETVEQIEEWLEARKEWHCELRDKLKAREEHLDSPLLCARAARRAWGDEPITEGMLEVDVEAEEAEHDAGVRRRHVRGNAHLPVWHAETWPRWRDVRFTVRPETEAVRVDDYLARDAAAWARSNRGIVWYEHAAWGEWVAELAGLPLHGGGPNAGEAIGAERGDRSIVASIRSHGRGRDGLQRLFSTQLVGNPPTSATIWEQCLGRLHRVGQRAAVVTCDVYRHTEEMAEAVNKAIRRAEYVAATIGASQKLPGAFR